MNIYNTYVIDWDKVNTLEDVITLLKGLNIRIQSHYERFDEIKHLLRLEVLEPQLGTWRNEFNET